MLSTAGADSASSLTYGRMTVNTKEMVGVPVKTKSEQAVGKVASFDVDANTGRIAVMRVKTRGLLPGLLSDELLIEWNAIIELNTERAVVMDAAVKQTHEAMARASSPAAAPTLMREG